MTYFATIIALIVLYAVYVCGMIVLGGRIITATLTAILLLGLDATFDNICDEIRRDIGRWPFYLSRILARFLIIIRRHPEARDMWRSWPKHYSTYQKMVRQNLWGLETMGEVVRYEENGIEHWRINFTKPRSFYRTTQKLTELMDSAKDPAPRGVAPKPGKV